MGYRGKLAERQQARELRAQGWTLTEIAEWLHVSKSSVSGWVRDVPFQPRAKPRPLQAARRRGPNALQRRKAAEIEELLEQGRVMIGTLSERDLLLAGIALYAGEGAKRDGAVAFSNSDPKMVGLFCRWLRRFFDIDEQRLRVTLYLHDGLDLDAAVAHWSRVTGIPASQFRKPYRAVPNAGIRTSKHVHGCATVGYSCARTHRAVMGLVAALLSASDPG